MDFNIHKYDNTTFSNNKLTNTRIKVLLLWFEYEVYKKQIPLNLQIPMMSDWIKKLESDEYYEVIPFFTNKLNDMIVEHEAMINDKNDEGDNMSDNIVVEPLLIRLKTKIMKLYKLIFKRD